MNSNLRIEQILNTLKQFSEEAGLTNILKGKIKKTQTYQKTIMQTEVSDKQYDIEFHTNIEKEHYNKICVFNQKLQNFSEQHNIKYKFLQYKYVKNDDFLPIQGVMTVIDNTPFAIQNENKFLFLVFCEINPFQPNSNLEFLRNKFNEISSFLKTYKNLDFRVVFIEGSSKYPVSNLMFYKKFSKKLSFQEKMKSFITDNYFENILFYYLPKISYNSLLKSSLEFLLEKEKMPYCLVVGPNNKVLYEGLFHIVDFGNTLSLLDKNILEIKILPSEKLKEIDQEIEQFKKITKDLHKNLTKEEYQKIKKILTIDFKQKISDLPFEIPFSYITEFFCLEKNYEFQNTIYIKTYKKALINYFFTKSLKKYYYDLKKLLEKDNLIEKVLDFSTSESKKIFINNVIHFFTSFFKDKNLNLISKMKNKNNFHILNFSNFNDFEKETYKLLKLFHIMNYNYITSPFVTFYNIFPCLNLQDNYLPIKCLEKTNNEKELFTLKFDKNDYLNLIIFISHNAFEDKSVYETKLMKIKSIFQKNQQKISKISKIAVIFFNTINDISFTQKSKMSLMQNFLALTSPFKNFEFFFLDSLKTPFSTFQHMVYFSTLNTVKAVLINSDKVVYNGSLINPSLIGVLDLALNKGNLAEKNKATVRGISTSEAKPYLEVFDLLAEEASLHIDRVLGNGECKISFDKCEIINVKNGNFTKVNKFYKFPKIKFVAKNKNEQEKLMKYLKSEVFSTLDPSITTVEISLVDNN